MKKNRIIDANAESELSAYTDESFRRRILSGVSMDTRGEESGAGSRTRAVSACITVFIVVCVAAAVVGFSFLPVNDGGGTVSEQWNVNDMPPTDTDVSEPVFGQGGTILKGAEARETMNGLVGAFDFVTDSMTASAYVTEDEDTYYIVRVLLNVREGMDGDELTLRIVPAGSGYRPYYGEYNEELRIFGERLCYRSSREDYSYTDENGEFCPFYYETVSGVFVTETESVYVDFSGVSDTDGSLLTEALTLAMCKAYVPYGI